MEHREETTNLISGDKVSGTNVYNTVGESVGEIRDVMIDKSSGKVVYAVLSFGGFLGMGEKYHPLPWGLLKYDTSREGYVVNLSKTQLEGAPAYEQGADSWWVDRAYETKVHKYYDSPTYWGAI
jgi:sporulation protein YlmC with PRC-barrel domain